MLWAIIVLPFMDSFTWQHPSTVPPCPTKDWIHGEIWQPITSFMDTTCSSKPEAFYNVTKIWYDGLTLRNVSPSNKVTHEIEFCTDYEALIKTTMTQFDPYLDSEEKFISDFMVGGHKHTKEHLCKNGEDGLRAQARRILYEHCEGNHTYEWAASKAITKCIPNGPFYQGMRDIDALMNKSDFCSNFRATTKCIVDDIAGSCTGRVFSSFLNTIFEKYLDLCNK